MKKNPSQTVLAALGARLVRAKGNLAEAREAAKKVLGFLPTPSACDHMALPKGVPLPSVPLFQPSPNPPMAELPTALFQSFDLLDSVHLPASWLPIYLDFQPRLHRAWWFCQLYPQGLQGLGHDNAPEVSQLDGVVAGLLLLALQPPTGSLLRARLFKRLAFHKFGALLAARGKLLAEEHLAILMLLGSDSRYLHWLSQWGWEAECPAYCARHLNLHAGLVMLPTPLGQDWLERLLRRAAEDAEAAAAALILQPSAPEQLWNLWADTIAKVASGTAACLAGRFARHTWPLPKWRELRERMKAAATVDKGRYWCEWHRHVSDGPEAEAALADPQAPLLWCLELLHATKGPDAPLRHLLCERLAANPADQESVVALDWLNLRQQRFP